MRAFAQGFWDWTSPKQNSTYCIQLLGVGLAAPFAFRVAWFDCDPAGIIFYPRVLAYMNEAVHAYLEQAGFSLEALNRRGIIGVPMVSLNVEYRKVLKLGDRARVETVITKIGTSSIRFTHRVFVDADLMVEATEVRVHAGRNSAGEIAAMPVPDDLRVALQVEGGA